MYRDLCKNLQGVAEVIIMRGVYQKCVSSVLCEADYISYFLWLGVQVRGLCTGSNDSSVKGTALYCYYLKHAFSSGEGW